MLSLVRVAFPASESTDPGTFALESRAALTDKASQPGGELALGKLRHRVTRDERRGDCPHDATHLAHISEPCQAAHRVS